MKLQTILGLAIIGLTIVAGILATIDGKVSLPVFYIWLGVVIIARIHIIYLEKE